MQCTSLHIPQESSRKQHRRDRGRTSTRSHNLHIPALHVLNSKHGIHASHKRHKSSRSTSQSARLRQPEQGRSGKSEHTQDLFYLIEAVSCGSLHIFGCYVRVYLFNCQASECESWVDGLRGRFDAGREVGRVFGCEVGLTRKCPHACE